MKLGLEHIEDLTADFVAGKRDLIAPKYLNVIYCSIKRWCYIQRMIKSTKMFRELRFDKTSRKIDALSEIPIEARHIKTMFKIANLEDAVDTGLYAMVGLRPQIIPQLRVKDIYRKNYEIDNEGRFRFTMNPPIMIIPRTYRGNKANISFFVFIPTRLAELIEIQLNCRGEVTDVAKISASKNTRAIWYKMRVLLEHPAINFKGRPYLLRSFADDINDRITRMFNDEDLKEFLMGHKGRMSAVYQLRGLTPEKERTYREMYTEACDEWINTHIFETRTSQETGKAEMLIKFARQLGVDESETTRLFESFEKAEVGLTQLEARLTDLANRALDNRMIGKFEQLYLKMEKKHRNKA